MVHDGQEYPGEKKGCAILVGDQVSGRNILTDLVDIENSQTAARALAYIKDELHLTPSLIVHDLSPNLIKATCDVFGADKMAFDPFHIMQTLNRAIAKDLKAFRATNFSEEKNALLSLRDHISKMLAEFRTHGEFRTDPLSTMPAISPTHLESHKCSIFAEKVLKLCRIQKEQPFMTEIRHFLREIYENSEEKEVIFAQSIEKSLPKQELTSKGHKRLILELLKKLKRYFLFSRKPLEQKQKEFSKNRHVLFFQPEKLTAERSKLIARFLEDYPELAIYRELTLRIGSIYRLPLEKIKDSLITKIESREEYGKELKTCLKTFKRHYKAIFRFRDVFLANPEMPRRSRANMEFNNRPVKQIFNSGLNCKGMERIQNELKLHLGGEVRNFMKAL